MRGKPMQVLFFTVFLDLLGFGIIIPLLPFVAQSTGANTIQITLIMASYSLMQFIMAPVWGRLSDRIGRRPVLLMSIGGSIVALLVFSLSTSYSMLLLARIVHGAMNANVAVAQAAVSDITTPQTRAKGMGMFGAAFGLGFVFGPALGGVLGANGLRTAALAAAALAVLNLVCALILLPETRPPAERGTRGAKEWRFVDTQLWRSPQRARLRGLFAMGFLVTTGFAAMESVFSLWSQRAYGWGALENGLTFTYLGVLIVVVQGGLIGPLRKRSSERSLALAGVTCLAIGLLLLPFALDLALLVAVTSIVAVSNGVLQPNVSALVTREVDPSETGRALGSFQSANALARIVGPLIAGVTFSIIAPGAPFFFGAVLIGLGGLVFFWTQESPPKPAPSRDEALPARSDAEPNARPDLTERA